MNESSPGPDTMSRLAAAAAAAIVAAGGLVTAPQTSNVTVPRAVPTIQLQKNLAVELTAAARQISTETTAPTQIAAATPPRPISQASLSTTCCRLPSRLWRYRCGTRRSRAL